MEKLQKNHFRHGRKGKQPKNYFPSEKGGLDKQGLKKLHQGFLSFEAIRGSKKGRRQALLGELLVEAYVKQVCANSKFDYCWASNDYIAEQLGDYHPKSISRIVGELVKKGVLSRITFQIGLSTFRRLYVGGGRDIEIKDPSHVQCVLGEKDPHWSYMTMCMALNIAPCPSRFGTDAWDTAVHQHYTDIHPYYKSRVNTKIKRAYGIDFHFENLEATDSRFVIFSTPSRGNTDVEEIASKGLISLTGYKKKMVVSFQNTGADFPSGVGVPAEGRIPDPVKPTAIISTPSDLPIPARAKPAVVRSVHKHGRTTVYIPGDPNYKSPDDTIILETMENNNSHDVFAIFSRENIDSPASCRRYKRLMHNTYLDSGSLLMVRYGIENKLRGYNLFTGGDFGRVLADPVGAREFLELSSCFFSSEPCYTQLAYEPKFNSTLNTQLV